MQEFKFISEDLNKSNSGMRSLYDFLDERCESNNFDVNTKKFERSLIIYDSLLQDQNLLTSNLNTDLLRHGILASPIKNISLQLRRNIVSESIKDLHIIAHGTPNGICFAGEIIDEKTLVANSDVLRSWKIKNLFLWSCEIGKNKNFVNLVC